MIDSKRFKELIRDHFSPLIREQGFKGTGFKYIKSTGDHYVFALMIQVNRYGGSCCIELGVHIDFLPDTIGRIIPPNKVDPALCDFRKRLVSNDHSWYEYGTTEEEAIRSIEKMKESFLLFGLPYFTQFHDFPRPLSSITLQEIQLGSERLKNLGAPLDTRLAMRLAQVNLQIGDFVKAKMFAERGIESITGRAGSGLIPIFDDIIVKATQA